MTRTSPVSAIRLSVATAFATALVMFLGFTAQPASAGPVGFQASGGWFTETEEAFLGAGLRFGLGTITVIPNAEWLFVDSGSAYTINLDATLSVLPLGVANGYLGAGVGWFTLDPDRGDSNTETAANLIAGAGFNAIPLKPFGQFKWIVVDGDDPMVFSAGVRF